MDNIEFNAFVTSTFRLTRTIIIKIEEIAERDNLALEQHGYVVSSDKRTWRYYMNLNGDYHPTDKVMYINSLDTGEQIIFNKENLELHRATWREYVSGGYWYTQLEEEYSGQTDLIRGILFPIPYDETISADNYKILRWNKDLVLWNEEQLIPGLQEWANAEVNLIFNNEYMITDDLVLPIMIMNLYNGLIQAIHTIRMEAVGTRYAHDFYIWARIDSYGQYSPYKHSLDRYQTMWLYRNIVWLTNNPGKQYTFGKLLENLLTHSGVPLAKYDMVENTLNQLDELTPEPFYRRLNLNLLSDYGRAASYITTPQLITKQIPQAKDNEIREKEWLGDAQVRGKYSLHSELPTKALESKMLDFTNRHLDTLMSVMKNEWIYLTAKGYYTASILITDPKTGRQSRVSSAEAYHMWYWMVTKAKDDKDLEVICPVYYNHVMKDKPPTVKELVAIGGYNNHVTVPEAQDIIKIHVPITRIISPERLKDYSVEVYSAIWNHKKLYSQYYELTKRSRVKHATDLVYESGYVLLGKDTHYKDVFERYEIDYTSYNQSEARDFAWEIFKPITGWNFVDSISLRTKQSDLIDIMLKLSSFTIHIIKEIDDGKGITELPNDFLIGYPGLIDGLPEQDPDFSGIQFDGKGHLDSQHELDGYFEIPSFNTIIPAMSSEGFAKFIDRSYFRPYELPASLASMALQFNNRNHFIEVDIVTPEMTVFNDEIYLGVLPKEL